MSYAVRVQNLKKSYGDNNVLKDVSFSVKKGEIFALLGINGAGKTTTLECIEGIKKYSSGNIDIIGNFGVQLQNSSFPYNITAMETVKLFSVWQNVVVPKEMILDFGIDEFKNRPYGKLSTGQKRKLHLLISLIGNPDIIFLDEPTAGLDVEGQIHIHSTLKKLKEQGKTIILSSHDMAEIEQLCDTVAIISNGEIAFCGSPDELVNNKDTTFKLMLKTSSNALSDVWQGLNVSVDNGYLIFECSNLENTLFEIIEVCKNNSISITDIEVKKDGIAEKFLKVAKGEE